MKGANKRWTLQDAESIAALICDRASDDNRWASRWPAQILARISHRMNKTRPLFLTQSVCLEHFDVWKRGRPCDDRV
jgi:hypothetical protein